MKRITIGAAFALACATAATPLVVTGAQAADHGGAEKATAFVAADAHAGLVKAAQAQSDAFVKALGLSSDDAFVVKDVITDADGSSHVRVDRTYKKVPVVGGDLVIHRDASGRVTGHDGTFTGAITVDLAPSVSKAQGQAKGLAAAKAHKARKGLDGAAVAGNDLVIYIAQDGTQRLAYQVRTTGLQKDRTPSRVRTLVDADSGVALRSFDEVHQGSGTGIYVGSVPLSTTYSGGTYSLRNPSTGNYTTDANNTTSSGATMTDADDRWGTGSNSNRQSAGVDAQFGADKTFDYYKTVMGRNGIWNDGRGARSRVHYDTNYENAFWDGTQMTYGDGAGNAHPLTELDVAGHEMSHGVTQNTAGLVYYGDAGGLNEATSDILGAGVEWYANLSTDVPDYYMGEEIDLNGNGTPLRYMDKPSKDGRSYDCWTPDMNGWDDQGAGNPHFTSGPLNHWYYLASEGSGSKTINGRTYSSPTCNSSTVTGAGHDKIEKIWYRTLSTKLTSSSRYTAAREGAIQSAIELYGASSQACASVEKAFSAISVPAGAAKCSSTSPTPTPTPTTPTPTPGSNAVVNGGFESGQTGWTGTSGPITANAGRAAHSGSWKLWLGGNGTTATEYEQQSVTVPNNGKLTFWVAVDTAETSTATAYDKATVTVNGTTVASYSNLTKTSGYVQKAVDLAGYAGQTVTLKLTATEDSSAQTSFVFDDIAVQ
ncbi:M4 family metallopeptidase [Arsenicicoccus cauae]|uniref:M4 family metallopeptidase n=1 Tax=Arsenicicoccus cauae TaxID=2663847 RepID=UPI00370D56EE